MDVELRLKVVEHENLLLRERVATLELLVAEPAALPVEWGLTPAETRVFRFLLKRKVCGKNAILMYVYGHVVHEDEIPQLKIIDVFICKMRKKLKPFGVSISTVWGQGYSLPPETRAAFHHDGGGIAA